MYETLSVTTGRPSPLGPSVDQTGVNFALFSAHATSVTLCLFSADGKKETHRVKLPSKTRDVWHGHVEGLSKDQLYGYRVDGPYEPLEGHRFNANKLLIDPYSKALIGDFVHHDALFGYNSHSPEKDLSFSHTDSAPFVPKCMVSVPGLNLACHTPSKPTQPRTLWADTIIYETHIKGFTKRLKAIPSKLRGTWGGLSDAATIKYLQSLGITAIELLPVQSFFTEPRLHKMGLSNYWGYNPVNYFSPHNAYLGHAGHEVVKDTIKALHEAEIEIILDVVYNHTAEGWELGPTLCYRGIDNKSYYWLDEQMRYYVNHTGCGNTLNLHHPAVLNLTLDSLRYWVETMGVDGFRFDLAPVLARADGGFDQHSVFFEALHADPVLTNVKLIAEPWDVGPGGYVIGQFPSSWAEWNDQYRDNVRRFWRGDEGAHQSLAGSLLGSAELFDANGRGSHASVNFIAAHDGFTLHDTVSYHQKHNHANGENNRDGHDHNESDNLGVEGPTNDSAIVSARRLRKKNMLATLLFSQGIPMLLAGDEFGHTMQGNNNAYCQDNELSWLDWNSADADLRDFVIAAIALRKKYPQFSQDHYLHGEAILPSGLKSVEWLTIDGEPLSPIDWEDRQLSGWALVLSMKNQNTLAVIFNRFVSQHFAWIDDSWTCRLSTRKIEHNHVIPANCVAVFEYAGYYLPNTLYSDTVKATAQQYGIQDRYKDINGVWHEASIDTLSHILKAMRIDVTHARNPMPIKEKTNQLHVFGAEVLRQQGGIWGITAALYGLRSARNWGIGDFEDLANLCETLAPFGVDFIGINPVHAMLPTAPHLFSPYSPSSREFLNILHIAPDKIPEWEVKNAPDLTSLRALEFVDYMLVTKTKMQALESTYANFTRLDDMHPRQKAFRAFQKQLPELRRHALFDTLFESLPNGQRTVDGWRSFDPVYHDPQSKACAEFFEKHRERVVFYMWLQWVAQTQLSDAQNRARAAGMSIGLYLDFAVGVIPGGSDSWRHQETFGDKVSLGAPGDAANPDGQNWQLLPFNPHALEQSNFAAYQIALGACMAHGGAIRIDHVLGLLRSFWIPDGSNEGAYVRYPFDALISIIAEKSQANHCIVFGEDLGTVPEGFREAMARRQLMGCNIQLVERGSDNQLIPREKIRTQSINAYTNHDFPTLTGFWRGLDFAWRKELGIGDDRETLSVETKTREHDKTVLADMAGLAAPPVDMTSELMTALQVYLAGAPSLAFAVQLEDLLLDPNQPNVPGTTDALPNWRRKSRLRIEDLNSDPILCKILDAISAARLQVRGELQ